MSKIYQVVIYRSISDQTKLAKYAELAGPAMKKAGAKFLARGVPVMVKEHGEKTRTVVVEWESLEQAENGYNSEDYQVAKAVREDCSDTDFMIIEGVVE